MFDNDEMTNTIKQKYDQKASTYDRFMAPMEKMMMAKWRESLISHAWGLVLEAGVGTGANLPYYKEGLKVIAVDFSPKMLEKAKEKLNSMKVPIELVEVDIQNLPFPDDMFDNVITACVFCSVPDPVKGFQELRRVIKKEGKMYLLEHVRSKKALWGMVMDYLNPVSRRLSGVNINRRTEENIERAGMKIIKVENLFMDIVKLMTVEANK